MGNEVNMLPSCCLRYCFPEFVWSTTLRCSNLTTGGHPKAQGSRYTAWKCAPPPPQPTNQPTTTNKQTNNMFFNQNLGQSEALCFKTPEKMHPQQKGINPGWQSQPKSEEYHGKDTPRVNLTGKSFTNKKCPCIFRRNIAPQKKTAFFLASTCRLLTSVGPQIRPLATN